MFNNTTANDDRKTPAKTQSRRVQNVVPLVVRQILDCPGEVMKLFNSTVHILNVVGIVREYNILSTKVMFTIEDHTARIKAVCWLESDGDSPILPDIREGHYLELFGTLRIQDGEKILMVLKMSPINDCNILTNHLLRVIHARLKAEKDYKTRKTAKETQNAAPALSNSLNFMDDIAGDCNRGFTPMQTNIFNIIKSKGTSEAGVVRDIILASFSKHQHKEVNNTLEFLINEGHVYSTIDNDHFKITAG